jgi:hypothetical protein
MVSLMEAGIPIKPGQSPEQIELTILTHTLRSLIGLTEDILHRPEKYRDSVRKQRVLQLCAKMRRSAAEIASMS